MFEPTSSNPAAERGWRAMRAGARGQLEGGLAPTDLQSLLIALAGSRGASVRPADLVARWRRDRFVQPSRCDPRRVSEVEAGLWRLLPGTFTGIELSPVAPLGSCTAVAPVSQNRIVTTMRLSEIISDSANALAIEAAVRRLDQPSEEQTHLAGAHRHFAPSCSGQAQLHTSAGSRLSQARVTPAQPALRQTFTSGTSDSGPVSLRRPCPTASRGSSSQSSTIP